MSSISNIYNQQKKDNNIAKTQSSSKKDEIAISNEARFYSTAMKAIRELPDTEGEKDLEQLKNAVKTGTYEVKNGELTEKIWQESILGK
jgi:anti-sigma28 factor (negative regulator of flagellin synthesis)